MVRELCHKVRSALCNQVIKIIERVGIFKPRRGRGQKFGEAETAFIRPPFANTLWDFNILCFGSYPLNLVFRIVEFPQTKMNYS